MNINATKLSEIIAQPELKRFTDVNIKYNPAKNEKEILQKEQQFGIK